MPYDFTYTARSPGVDGDRIALGEARGVYQVNRFSKRTDLDIADGFSILCSDNTTNSYQIIDTATTLTITYNNATDGLGTNGALSLLFDYLDENLIRQQTVHALGNTGSDVTSFSTFGVNTVTVVLSGPARSNVNDISITSVADGSVQSYIAATESISSFSVFHVPTNAKMIVRYFEISGFKAVGGQEPLVSIRARVFSRDANTIYSPGSTGIDASKNNIFLQLDPLGFPVGPRNVFMFEVSTDQDNSIVSAGITHIFYEDRNP